MIDNLSMDVIVLFYATLKEIVLEDPFVQIIASLSAASNVTGILTDTDAVTEIVHNYGGYAFWDYASAGEYNRNVQSTSLCSLLDMCMTVV